MTFERKQHLLHALFGLLMGLSLSHIGFTNFTEVHNMFIFADLRMFLAFAGGVGLIMIGFAILGRGKNIAKKSYTKGTVPGSILFGLGWAITGCCPSIAVIQLGEGQLPALFTIAGIFAGVWLYRRMTTGAFQFDTGICGEAE